MQKSLFQHITQWFECVCLNHRKIAIYNIRIVSHHVMSMTNNVKSVTFVCLLVFFCSIIDFVFHFCYGFTSPEKKTFTSLIFSLLFSNPILHAITKKKLSHIEFNCLLFYTYFPTKFSSTDDLPALCPPTTAICGKSNCICTPNCVNASCSLFTIGMSASIPWLPDILEYVCVELVF